MIVVARGRVVGVDAGAVDTGIIRAGFAVIAVHICAGVVRLAETVGRVAGIPLGAGDGGVCASR